MTDLQVVARLRYAFEASLEQFTFESGDILLHKWPDLATTNVAERPVVFIDYLDYPIDGSTANVTDPHEYTSAAAAQRWDARILTFQQGMVVPHLVDSTHYRPHPDFEREAAQ